MRTAYGSGGERRFSQESGADASASVRWVWRRRHEEASAKRTLSPRRQKLPEHTDRHAPRAKSVCSGACSVVLDGRVRSVVNQDEAESAFG